MVKTVDDLAVAQLNLTKVTKVKVKFFVANDLGNRLVFLNLDACAQNYLQNANGY